MAGDSASESARASAPAPCDDAVEAPLTDRADPVADVPDKLLASAFEFAVGIVAAGVKVKAPLAHPAALKPFLKFTKLPANAHPKVRAAIEGDPSFRAALARAAKAAPELLDEASLLWITRPAGWEDRLHALVAEVGPADLAAELRRAERRREAAEAAAHRVLAEVVALRGELDRRADVSTTSTQEIDRLRADLATARTEVSRHQAALRRATDQVRAADDRTAAALAERDAALARAEAAERIRDDVLADRAAGDGGAAARADEAAVLAGAAAVADELGAQSRLARQLVGDLDRLVRRLHELEPVSIPEPSLGGASGGSRGAAGAGATRGSAKGRRPQRTPIAVPGGLYGDSLAAAEHVVRHPNAVVIVDGYNVAKLRFPTLSLEQQRERTIDLCEDLARRWGTNVVVVFDGTNASGVAGTSRRLVRVTYSPEGTIADDVIRAEVAALPAEVPVVVVTNDQAVVTDVRGMGANPVSSDRFLELATR